MVVIGIIAILGAVIVPGFKKAYDDFKIRETYHNIDIVLSAIRSYCLVCSEQEIKRGFRGLHGDKKAVPFFPSSCVDASQYTGTSLAYPSEYCKGWLLSFYLFGEVLVQTGEFGNSIRLGYRTRPYYCDDLINRYRQMGCLVEDQVADKYIRISPQERHQKNWFR